MLQKKRTNGVSRMKYLALIPLAIGSVLMSCSNSNTETPVESTPINAVIENKTEDTAPASLPQGETVFTVVEVMPSFPGGDQELLKYIGQSIQYPIEAQEKGIQGRVICTFVVTKDGNITDAEVIRGVDPLLDAEALRVVGMMPVWTPGKQKGEAVNVKYTIPIIFRLSE